MNENLSSKPIDARKASGNQIDTSDNLGLGPATNNKEVSDEKWGGDLTIKVATNAHRFVRCPWMDGAKVTLGDAMTTYSYPENMTAADEPFLMSVVDELLASEVLETGEVDEEISMSEEISAEPEASENLTEVVADGGQKQPKKDTTAVKRPEPPIVKVEEPVEPQIDAVAKIEAEVEKATDSAHIIEVSDTAPVEQTTASHTTDSPTPESTVVAVGKNIEAEGPIAIVAVTKIKSDEVEPVVEPAIDLQTKPITAEISKEQTASKLTDHDGSISVNSLSTIEQATESITLPKVVEPLATPETAKTLTQLEDYETFTPPETAVQTKTTEQSTSDLEVPPISNDLVELGVDTIETSGREQTLPNLDSRTDTHESSDFIEGEILLIDHPKPAIPEPGDLYKLSHEPTPEITTDNPEVTMESPDNTVTEATTELGNVEVTTETEVEEATTFDDGSEESSVGQIEAAGPEQTTRVNPSIESVEDSLTALNENIDTAEPEVSEEAKETIDTIVEALVAAENLDNEDIITEAQTQEIVELYTELFDILTIDTEPELIKYLAYVTLAQESTDETEGINCQEELGEESQDTSVRAAVKKLLLDISLAKKASTQVSTIGRSALELYRFKCSLGSVFGAVETAKTMSFRGAHAH